MMKTKALTRLIAAADPHDYRSEATISFKISGDGKYSVARLLTVLAYLGSAGASRTIVVEDVPKSAGGHIEEGDMQFGFDGDGADQITDLTMDGKPYKMDDAFPPEEVKASTKRRVFAAEVMEHGFDISTGSNSFKCHSPQEAYQKAANFIHQIQNDGFKFTKNGAMSKKMDVFKKGADEISISVRDSILNIDLW